jgi:hypothetical protein
MEETDDINKNMYIIVIFIWKKERWIMLFIYEEKEKTENAFLFFLSLL